MKLGMLKFIPDCLKCFDEIEKHEHTNFSCRKRTKEAELQTCLRAGAAAEEAVINDV